MCRSVMVIASLICFATQAADLTTMKPVDLSHTYNDNTIFWPTSPSEFELEELAHGMTDGGYFYAANAFSSPEHGGTHLDAPIHFFAARNTVDQVPLQQLIGPAVVIDISASAAGDADYRLTVDDVIRFERRHGQIAENAIVLLRTDWSKRWPDTAAYMGDDTQGDASNLHFPSFGVDAAKLLVLERKIKMLGVDTASIDYGQSTDFMVHRIAAEHNVIGLENLTNLDQLPPTGAQVIALPMKIGGGSGAPTRVIALID